MRTKDIDSRLNRLSALNEIIDRKRRGVGMDDVALADKIREISESENDFAAVEQLDHQLDLALFHMQLLIQKADACNIEYKKITKAGWPKSGKRLQAVS